MPCQHRTHITGMAGRIKPMFDRVNDVHSGLNETSMQVERITIESNRRITAFRARHGRTL